MVIECYPWLFVVMDGYHWLCTVIECYSWLLMVIEIVKNLNPPPFLLTSDGTKKKPLHISMLHIGKEASTAKGAAR